MRNWLSYRMKWPNTIPLPLWMRSSQPLGTRSSCTLAILRSIASLCSTCLTACVFGCVCVNVYMHGIESQPHFSSSDPVHPLLLWSLWCNVGWCVQGCTVMFAALLRRPELADKIEMFFALAPVIYIAHTNSPILKGTPNCSSPTHFFLLCLCVMLIVLGWLVISVIAAAATLRVDQLVQKLDYKEFLPTSSFMRSVVPWVRQFVEVNHSGNVQLIPLPLSLQFSCFPFVFFLFVGRSCARRFCLSGCVIRPFTLLLATTRISSTRWENECDRVSGRVLSTSLDFYIFEIYALDRTARMFSWPTSLQAPALRTLCTGRRTFETLMALSLISVTTTMARKTWLYMGHQPLPRMISAKCPWTKSIFMFSRVSPSDRCCLTRLDTPCFCFILLYFFVHFLNACLQFLSQ